MASNSGDKKNLIYFDILNDEIIVKPKNTCHMTVLLTCRLLFA